MNEDRKFGLDDVPHQPTIYVGIVVDQDISEEDYALVVADFGNHGTIDSGELLHRPADDLEFPFHSSAHHGVAHIVRELLVLRKLSNQHGGSMNVVQELLGLKLHRQVSLSALSIAGSKDS